MLLGRIFVSDNGPQNVATATAVTPTFGTVNYDTLGIWNSGTPTQIVIPAGTHFVRVWAHCHFFLQNTIGAITAIGRARVLLNGVPPTMSSFGLQGVVIPSLPALGTTALGCVMTSPYYPSTAGDVWSLSVDQETGQTMTIGGLGFAIEFYDS
jgi:hypothetical protein